MLLADAVPPEAIFRILGADNKRGAYTEIGRDRLLRLVRDFRAEAEEAAAAAMDDSAAAAGSADDPAPVARAEGAGGVEAGTEESSSDSDLPDTTAPAWVFLMGPQGGQLGVSDILTQIWVGRFGLLLKHFLYSFKTGLFRDQGKLMS